MTEHHAQILAVSMDKEATQAAFRREIGAPFAFVADSGGELTRLYDVKTPLLPVAKRTTFVIGKDREILHIDSGSDAVDPEGAIEACRVAY